ncbi:MAG: hypothetical protein ACRDY2_01700 [Acidimicrobiales bacterium]
MLKVSDDITLDFVDVDDDVTTGALRPLGYRGGVSTRSSPASPSVLTQLNGRYQQIQRARVGLGLGHALDCAPEPLHECPIHQQIVRQHDKTLSTQTPSSCPQASSAPLQ